MSRPLPPVFPEFARDYVDRVEALLERTDAWCVKRGLYLETKISDRDEEVTGPYQAPGRLIFAPDGAQLCEIFPAFAVVMCGPGRVDFIGPCSDRILTYLRKPKLDSTRPTWVDGHCVGPVTTNLAIRGFNCDDWYFIDGIRPRARRLDEELFLDLIYMVSRHDFD